VLIEVSNAKIKIKRAVKTYVSGAIQHVVELVPKVPVVPSILEELDRK
jgi:hypothetical protein